MTAPDSFAAHSSGLDSPADDFVAVTPADADLTFRCRALYVGGAGNVHVLAKDGVTVVIFTAVPAGTILPIRTSQVRAATTATAIVALK